jgi:hypothetical protein
MLPAAFAADMFYQEHARVTQDAPGAKTVKAIMEEHI